MSETPGGQADGAGGVAFDVASITRVATELAAAAAVAKRLPAAAAAVEAAFVRNGLLGRITLAVPKALVPHLINLPDADEPGMTATPATAPSPKFTPPRKHRHSGAAQDAARAAARSWFLAREAALRPGEKPPSERQDWIDARRDGVDAPRQIIRDLRPLAWRQNPTRKPAAPKGGASL